jgi:hypothetical protein
LRWQGRPQHTIITIIISIGSIVIVQESMQGQRCCCNADDGRHCCHHCSSAGSRGAFAKGKVAICIEAVATLRIDDN